MWHADGGATEPVSYRIEGGETLVPLDLSAEQSLFVVFRAPTQKRQPRSSLPVSQLYSNSKVLGRSAFNPAVEHQRPQRYAALRSLTQDTDPGVRYFSGIATYETHFRIPADIKPGTSLQLDLGGVGDVAEVWVNDKPSGIAWKPPYRVDVTQAVKPGQNRLRVRVADLWVNRLIGDAQPGAQKITYTSMPTYLPNAPLRPAGLMGPVQLLAQQSGVRAR